MKNYDFAFSTHHIDYICFRLENTADVVVVEELNTGFYPPPPNISNIETNQLPGTMFFYWRI